ncbi:hypothetical protein C1Y40_01882 [Mycobacterium talmoniae]|uniref:Uncharacterized protein n=1 Tax=Mycobacterium talmoniae TaxID=1858794 RepID=A0A2S8BMI6_9MYCO|nr:hypothetical protein C1Y40_01882 [Mycobacterium talmoniae]
MGCPVSENGPLPVLQIAPVARCRLQTALVFQVPCVLWLSPIVQQLIQLAASPIHWAAVRMSASGMPVISATWSGGNCSAKLGITSQPSVNSAMNSSSVWPFWMSRCSRPLSSARSVPGAICKNRSAFSAVAVRRGSTTISLAPALTRSISRRNKIGWQSAILAPITKNTSA